jgi:hypothetical protein
MTGKGPLPEEIFPRKFNGPKMCVRVCVRGGSASGNLTLIFAAPQHQFRSDGAKS